MFIFVFFFFIFFFFFFSSRRRHTRWNCDWSSDVCSSDLNSTSERLQWSSSARTTRKTEYAYHTPYARPSVTKVATRDWLAAERTFIPKLLDFNRSGRRNR